MRGLAGPVARADRYDRGCVGWCRPYVEATVVSRIRRAIAVVVALVVSVLTLGSVRVDWSGASRAAHGAEDPGRAAITRPASDRAPRR
jgi:hypothetical protein